MNRHLFYNRDHQLKASIHCTSSRDFPLVFISGTSHLYWSSRNKFQQCMETFRKLMAHCLTILEACKMCLWYNFMHHKDSITSINNLYTLIMVSTLYLLMCDNRDNHDYFVYDNRFCSFFNIAQHYIHVMATGYTVQ